MLFVYNIGESSHVLRVFPVLSRAYVELTECRMEIDLCMSFGLLTRKMWMCLKLKTICALLKKKKKVAELLSFYNNYYYSYSSSSCAIRLNVLLPRCTYIQSRRRLRREGGVSETCQSATEDHVDSFGQWLITGRVSLKS